MECVGISPGVGYQWNPHTYEFHSELGRLAYSIVFHSHAGLNILRLQKGHTMKTPQGPPQTIDEYISGFPKNVQDIMQKIRATIKKAAPDAEETIRYKMPTFNLQGHYLVYFAGYKKHIGFYPAPIGRDEFKAEIAPYESGKGTLQFPLDQPIPYKLITKSSGSVPGKIWREQKKDNSSTAVRKRV